MKAKIFTKKPMVYFSSRMPKNDLELLRAASSLEGLSVSEFFRLSVRERARQVLSNVQKIEMDDRRQVEG